MKNKLLFLFLFLGIFSLAAYFRLYGINWDQNQHLHPDERFLTMVSGAISWPRDIWEYLDSTTSPLNPHNQGYGFFVYGTFPIFFTKWIAEIFKQSDYNGITIVGRQLSALFDMGTVLLVFLIAKQVVKSQAPNTKYQTNHKHQIPNIKQSSKFKYLWFRILKLFGICDFEFWIFPLLSMFFYTIMVLPIQLSHFFAVDTYLTFFITLSFYLLIRLIVNSPAKGWSAFGGKFLILNSFLGVSFGLALASKISAVFFLPVIILGLLIKLIKSKKIFLIFNSCFLILISAYFTFRLAQPYLFAHPDIFDITLNQKVVDNWKQLKSFDDPKGWFPPGVQWITTKLYIFPLKNMIFWGLGLPLGIISILAVGYGLWVMGYGLIKKKNNSQLTTQNSQLILILLWILIIFFYQGFQFVKALRYFYPIYPFLAILSGFFVTRLIVYLKHRYHLKSTIVALFHCCIVSLFLIYPLSFISIYSLPHSRIAASEWIYRNIPAGSTLSGEHWDDYLPISLPQSGMIRDKYITVELPLYNIDDTKKWKEMDTKLKKVDYIILSSNRLYGSIMTIPNRYPATVKYYRALFDGSLGFTKIAEFTSRPNIPFPLFNICLTPPLVHYGIVALPNQDCPKEGISFVDDYADETFTVYDHPKVIIFKKTKQVDYLKTLSVAL